MALTGAQKQKAIRQDALREMLSKKCTVQQVIANIEKMEGPEAVSMEPQELNALKYATDTRVKLLGKYLPDLKATEHSVSGDDENPLTYLIKEISGQTLDPYRW